MNEAMGLTADVREYVCGNFNYAFALGRFAFAGRGNCGRAKWRVSVLRALSAIEKFGCNALGGPAGPVLLMFRQLHNRMEALGDQIHYIKMASQAVSVEDSAFLWPPSEDEALPKLWSNRSATRDSFRNAQCLDKLASSGKPVGNNEVKIWNPNGTGLLPQGSTGLIAIKAPVIMRVLAKT